MKNYIWLGILGTGAYLVWKNSQKPVSSRRHRGPRGFAKPLPVPLPPSGSSPVQPDLPIKCPYKYAPRPVYSPEMLLPGGGVRAMPVGYVAKYTCAPVPPDQPYPNIGTAKLIARRGGLDVYRGLFPGTQAGPNWPYTIVSKIVSENGYTYYRQDPWTQLQVDYLMKNNPPACASPDSLYVFPKTYGSGEFSFSCTGPRAADAYEMKAAMSGLAALECADCGCPSCPGEKS